jgi:hypothetical protein
MYFKYKTKTKTKTDLPEMFDNYFIFHLTSNPEKKKTKLKLKLPLQIFHAYEMSCKMCNKIVPSLK